VSDPASIWMPLYVAEWDADTAHLSNEEDGAYGRLTRYYWRNGPLPDDDKMLARIVRDQRAWKRLRPIMLQFFRVVDGQWRHKRIDAERDRALRFVESRRANGAKGGRPPKNLVVSDRIRPEKPTQNTRACEGEGEGASQEDNNSQVITGNGTLTVIDGGKPK